MARVIAVTISKGGVGKTTTAVNLAAGLAALGVRTLLVDADTQAQAGMFLGCAPSAGLPELVAGEISPDRALVQARPGLYLLAGGRGLAGLKRAIDRREFGGEHTLSEALAPLVSQFDVIIFDTGPGWDSLTVAVLFASQELLVPVSCEAASLAGLAQFTKSVSSIQRYKPELRLAYVLPTFADGRVKKTREILEQLRQRYGRFLADPIRYSVRLSEAAGAGQTIAEYAPGSTGEEDYAKLIGRVYGQKADA